MRSRYYVTADLGGGEEIIGIYFDQRLLAERAEPGAVILADVILPMSYEVDESSVHDLTWYEAVRYVDAAREESVEHSRALGPGIAVGKVFSLTHEEGDIWYVVTDLTDTEAEVEWRGYGETRRTDRRLGWGGIFDRKIIQGHIARHDAIDELGGLALDALLA
jgi:hypothetical protein